MITEIFKTVEGAKAKWADAVVIVKLNNFFFTIAGEDADLIHRWDVKNIDWYHMNGNFGVFLASTLDTLIPTIVRNGHRLVIEDVIK